MSTPLRRTLCSGLLAVFIAAAAPYNRLYVFGDSYSDTGSGYLDGNGPTAVAYLAERMGTPLALATDPKSGAKSINFAVSGAQSGSGAGRKVKDALLGYGMRNQVDDFAARVKSHDIAFKPESTLFFLAGGLNDRSLPDGATAQNLKGEIKTLYDLGARHFMVALMPTAIPSFSAVGKRLNPELSRIPTEIAPEIPGATIATSNWGPYFDEVMTDPAKYGIENTKDKCAGRAIFDEDTTPCAKPDAYYFFHSGHPSTAVHKAVGEKMYQELQSR